MTDFLNVNNFNVPILDGQARKKRNEFGIAGGRGFTGQLIDTRRALKRDWEFQTPVLLKSKAEAIEFLIQGLGYHFPYDEDLFSARTGLGPNPGYGAFTLATAAPVPKFGAKRLNIPSGGEMVYNIPGACDIAGVASTMMAWIDVAGTYHHYVLRIDGEETSSRFKDGVATADLLGTFSIDAGLENFKVRGKEPVASANAVVALDDLVILNWFVSTEMITAFAAATRPFSDMPLLEVKGDSLDESTTDPTDNGPVSVRGNLGGTSFVQAVIEGAFGKAQQEVTFTLDEE